MRPVGLFKPRHLGVRQCQFQSCNRVVQVVWLPCPDDRCCDSRLLRDPGQRDLRSRNSPFLSDLAQR